MNLPAGEKTLQSLLDSIATRGDRPCLVAFQEDSVETWSYRELADRAGRIAVGLSNWGIGRGEPVAILAPSTPEAIAACLGVIRAGGVIVPLDIQFGDETLAHVLEDSGARFIFTTLDEGRRIGNLPSVSGQQLVYLDAGEDHPDSWHRLPDEAGRGHPQVTPDDPAALFYTSGTTGPPKGVPLSHANLRFQIAALENSGLVQPDERVLLPLPLHHVYPFVIGVLTPLALGLTIVLPRSLTGQELTRALRDGKVTLIAGVPRLYRALYSGIESRFTSKGKFAGSLFRGVVSLSTRLSRWLGVPIGKALFLPLHRKIGPKVRMLAAGGSALDPGLAARLEGLGWKIAIGYGLTETAPLLSMKLPGRDGSGSVGRPVPGVEIRIAPDQSTEEDRVEQSGEIQARGPNVFAGYRHLADETAEAFTRDGWFRTGDLGYFDPAGNLYVLGRASTMIVTEGGENIQPEEVEEAYQNSTVISEIGVLQKDGRLVGVVVPDAAAIGRGEAATRTVIRDALWDRSKHLPSYQRIGDFVIHAEPLPRTRLGKLRRHLLAELYDRLKSGPREAETALPGPISPAEMSREDRDLLGHPAAGKVWEWLGRRFPDQRLTPDTSLQLDLGVDSLGWVDLTLEIGETAGMELTEEAIWRIDKVRDLLREVTAASGSGKPVTPATPLEEPEAFLTEGQMRWLRPLGPLMAGLSRLMFGLNWVLMRGLFRVRVEGLDRLPDQGPFLLTPNHASHLDPLALAAVFGQRRLRQTYWAGWTGVVFSNPLFRFISRLGRVVPIDTDRGFLSNLAFGAAVLKRNHNLVVFPEGERSLDGSVQPFKAGTGLLLDRYPVPVVPVLIQGTHAAMPPGARLPRLKRIRIVVGQPVDPRELEQRGEGSHPQDRIVRALRKRVSELGNSEKPLT